MNEIEQALRNGLTIDEVCEKYKVSFKDLFKICNKKKITPFNQVSDYVYRFGTRYIIQKSIDNRQTKFGSWIKLEEALKIRDELKEKNWEVDPLDYLGDKYISMRDNHYKITKSFGRFNTKSYGTYRTLDDARKVRDCLARLDWDKDYLDLILKRLGVERLGNKSNGRFNNTIK